MAELDENGHEILDSTPRAIPVRILKRQNEAQRMQDFIRHELSRQMQSQGFGSFEEEDDFEVGDDVEPWSPHELADEQYYERGDPPVVEEASPPAEPISPAE